MKDGQSDRQGVPISDYEKLSSVHFQALCISFLQSFMTYTTVYQQQETGHGEQKNSSTVGKD
jgi:hypothetical protein